MGPNEARNRLGGRLGGEEPALRLRLRRLPHGELRSDKGLACAHRDDVRIQRRDADAAAHQDDGRVGSGPDRPTLPQAQGNAPMSELDVGCSSCHYGVSLASNSTLADLGSDPNNTAHTAAYYNDLANGEICGACHSRYSYTTNTYPVNADPDGDRSPTTLVQLPQMAIAYPWSASLRAAERLPRRSFPGWSPTPESDGHREPGIDSATSGNCRRIGASAAVQRSVQRLAETADDGSAPRYPERLSEGHANALVDLKAAWAPTVPASCLQCHSADYRIAAPTASRPDGCRS